MINLPEHNEKYNVDKTKLEEANKKIRELSLLARGDDFKVVNEKIIRKRTDKDYLEIWTEFLTNEESDFRQKMMYGKEEIERIGINKFIDTMDWSLGETGKWRTDRMYVVICCNCKDNFSIYNHGGLCPTCEKDFRLDDFLKICTSSKILEKFYFDPKFRNEYKRK